MTPSCIGNASMMKKHKSDRVLGIVIVLASLLILSVWVPNDIETGVIERVRRRTVLGDSLLPVFAASVLLLSGALLSIGRPSENRGLTVANLRFIFGMGLIFVVTLVVMRFAGPLLVDVAGDVVGAPDGYRALRDTAPWKYIGFVLGGAAMILSMVWMAERRIGGAVIVTALAAVLGIIMLFDIPFDDLLLPPNGDV